MRTLSVLFAAALTLATVTAALADATAPTNGGSNNGGGQSGVCTGSLADRPANCGPH